MGDDNRDSKFEMVQTRISQLTGYAVKLAIVILFAVVAWRTAWASFSLDLSKFEFSDLLAMILALFAVGMSVAFYFKTTDSSNQFFYRVYDFTQRTSVILGRIEERFGKQLEHLQSSVDDFSRSPQEIKEQVKATEGQEKEEKQKLKATNEAMQEMMRSLVEKAELQEKEKKDFYHKLEQLTAERDSAQERIRVIEEDRDRMQMELCQMEQDMVGGISPQLVKELLHHPEWHELITSRGSEVSLRRHARYLSADLPSEVRAQLEHAGITDSSGALTSKGLVLLRNMARHSFGPGRR